MPLPHDYKGQECSLARSLEVLGERWTLLIIRDAFYGVRRFGDFVAHLGIPRAVLTERLHSLGAAGVLARVSTPGGRDEYELTDRGVTLWPVLRSLVDWGDENYSTTGPRRLFTHESDGAPIGVDGRCAGCGVIVPPGDVLALPGPGLPAPSEDDDPVTAALAGPRRLLQPLRG